MEKKKRELKDIHITTIIILILVFGYICVYFTFFKPEFKITKEECWNETIKLSIEETNDYLINECTTLGSWWTNYEFKENSKDFRFCFFSKKIIEKNIVQELCKKYGIEYREDYEDYECIGKSDKIIKIEGKKVCKQVEVEKDTMLYFSDEDDIYLEGELVSGIGQSRISIEWLDENCECVENIEYNRNSAENSINVPCSKYSCGEYQVEVLK